MNETDRPRELIDALHAELLGGLVDIQSRTAQIQADLPAAQQNVHELVSDAKRAFDEMRQQSMAIVGYVKGKQLETIGEINAAHVKITAESHKVLSGFERIIWAGLSLNGVNTVLLLVAIGLLIFDIFRQ